MERATTRQEFPSETPVELFISMPVGMYRALCMKEEDLFQIPSSCSHLRGLSWPSSPGDKRHKLRHPVILQSRVSYSIPQQHKHGRLADDQTRRPDNHHHVPVDLTCSISTMTYVDPTAQYLEPRGFGVSILVVNLIFLALAVVFVGVRACVRSMDKKFCVDDGFMIAGTIAYAGQIGLSSWACFTGLGAPDSQHNELMLSETKEIYVVWVIVYNFALALIKSAICLTMARIFAYQAKYVRATALSLIAITWAAFIIALVGILAGCQPISANWSNATGKCTGKLTFAVVTYIITATALFTDVAIVVLNISVLWKTMMPWSAKIQVFSFMSFASLASIFSIVRTVFLTDLSDITTLDTSNQGQVNASGE